MPGDLDLEIVCVLCHQPLRVVVTPKPQMPPTLRVVVFPRRQRAEPVPELVLRIEPCRACLQVELRKQIAIREKTGQETLSLGDARRVWNQLNRCYQLTTGELASETRDVLDDTEWIVEVCDDAEGISGDGSDRGGESSREGG